MDDGGPAFSTSYYTVNDDHLANHRPGMTLLDYFAAHLSTVLWRNAYSHAIEEKKEDFAKQCYDIAAAMIEEKRRRENKE
jgi:hypothetical protein